jgi:hypothetical protein
MGIQHFINRLNKIFVSKSRDILIFVIAVTVFLGVLSCSKIKQIFEGDKSEKQSERVDIKDDESEGQSDGDMSSEDRQLDSERDDDYYGETQSNRLDLMGTYGGTFHGKKFEIIIKVVNGKNITGYNVAYWTNPPYKTNMTGTFDESTGEIVFYEEQNERGTGIFEGILSSDGKTMKGSYSPVSSNEIFSWSVSKDSYFREESSTKNTTSFKDFAREFIKKASSSKDYYLSHSQNTINVIYTEGGMQRTTKKNMSAGSYYDEFQFTASICKGTIGNNMINYRQPVEGGSGYYDGYFKMYFKKDNSGNWKLYKIDNLEAN